jgi:hypothetical protein
VAGNQILGSQDDNGNIITPPTSPFDWNGNRWNQVNISSNGAVGFAASPSSSYNNGPYSPDSLGWFADDLYQNWVRAIVLPDGFYWQFDTRLYSNSSTNIKITIRYVNGGKWILTWFDSTGITGAHNLGAWVGGVNLVKPVYVPPVVTNPASAGVIVVETGVISSVSLGPELAFP